MPRKRKSSADDASPAKSVVEQLDYLRKQLRITAQRIADGVEGEIAAIQREVETMDSRPSRERLADLRDMLIQIRRLDIRPEKGRRKDLKRIENLTRDLQEIVDGWN